MLRMEWPIEKAMKEGMASPEVISETNLKRRAGFSMQMRGKYILGSMSDRFISTDRNKNSWLVWETDFVWYHLGEE